MLSLTCKAPWVVFNLDLALYKFIYLYLLGVIGVVKAGAYGHGSVHVSRHLKATGVERLAVATIDEAIHLRSHGITGPIHVLGN